MYLRNVFFCHIQPREYGSGVRPFRPVSLKVFPGCPQVLHSWTFWSRPIMVLEEVAKRKEVSYHTKRSCHSGPNALWHGYSNHQEQIHLHTGQWQDTIYCVILVRAAVTVIVFYFNLLEPFFVDLWFTSWSRIGSQRSRSRSRPKCSVSKYA